MILCCISTNGHKFAANFCTCHDGTAVMPCAKFCSNQLMVILIEGSNDINFEFWVKNNNWNGSVLCYFSCMQWFPCHGALTCQRSRRCPWRAWRSMTRVWNVRILARIGSASAAMRWAVIYFCFLTNMKKCFICLLVFFNKYDKNVPYLFVLQS